MKNGLSLLGIEKKKLPNLYICYQICNFMRVIAVSALREFWRKFPDSELDLKIWNAKMKEANYQNANEVKTDTPTADQVGNNRIVFNICRNKYRLVVVFRYKMQAIYIRFIGTHKEYDKIENIKFI
jgi:mRNA interferase HigB